MFSHIVVSVSSFKQAYPFYQDLMATLGVEQRFSEPDRPWAGWHSTGESRPYFVLCEPFDKRAHDPGNGQMVAFMARDRSTVISAYEVAMRNGGNCEGPPGLRPEYHEHYFGAYFRDPAGNKLCVVCHNPEPKG